jgi:hypothetical protein
VLNGSPGRVFVNGSATSLNSSDAPFILMGGGNDAVIISGGQIGTAASTVSIFLDSGAAPLGVDTFRMSGGLVSGSVFGLGGGNTYQVSGGTILGSIFAGSQNDTVTISGTANIHGDFGLGPDAVGLEAGNDRFTMKGGTLDGAVSGGDGDDVLAISGGTIKSFVAGNDGADRVTISGGTISGDVDAESVTIGGGTIGGDISGISSNTLIINDALSAAPVNLRDGVTFSGTNAVAAIIGTDLAAGGAKTQNFLGFAAVTANNSTVGFGPGAVDIGQLTLVNGSTLFSRGAVSMPGNVTLANSTISMINGAAGDLLTLGGLALNNGLVGVDVDQAAALADQIAAGAVTGTGTLTVNLLGRPSFTNITTIPIITSGAILPGAFTPAGLPGTQASLFTYALLPTPTGLALQIAPGAFGPVAAPQDATDVSIVETVLDALDGIKDDALDFDLGLGIGNGPALVPISDTFGVFASGQLAHTEHDGFDITANGFTGPGPGFGADEFSAAISLDFNVAKMMDVDDQYGINLGLFGGYASVDVDLDDFQGFPVTGHGENQSGMFGGYGLFRKELNYALIAATAFLGNSDVTNGILGSDGSYDTTGYAVTSSIGHIFVIGDRTRFDLRGGVLGVHFEGDDYADSKGFAMGGSEISFGAVKFEPGIYADFPMGDGMTFSPYARAELQERFGYENTASIDGLPIEFDDADFSAALSTGFNLKMSARATMSGEVRGKVSSDSTTVAGKLGLKIAF